MIVIQYNSLTCPVCGSHNVAPIFPTGEFKVCLLFGCKNCGNKSRVVVDPWGERGLIAKELLPEWYKNDD